MNTATMSGMNEVLIAAERLATAAREKVPCAPVRDLIGEAEAYAVQQHNIAARIADGATVVGRKIGLTSPAVQQQLGVDQPDFGVLLDDMAYEDGDELPVSGLLQPKVEAELAFVLKEPLEGPDCTLEDALAAIDYAVPALEVLNSHIELEGRTIIDTIADNAAYGAMVLGDVHRRPDEIDVRWIPGLLYRNGEIIETGVAAGVLDHPVSGVAWLANKFHQHGARLEAGEIILAGSFTRPMWVARGDEVLCDYGPMGVISCRFV